MTNKGRIFLSKLVPWVRERLPVVISAVTQAQTTHGDEPGETRLQVAADLLAQAIDIKWVPDRLERPVIEALLTVVVELAKLVWGKKDWWVHLEAALQGESAE